MIRVKRGCAVKKRRKKSFKLAKGYVGANSRLSTMIGEQIVQSKNFAYISRRLKKRDFRKIWISRINAISKCKETNYSTLIGQLRKLSIFLNRKVLSFMAFHDIYSFNLINRTFNKDI